MIQQRADSIHKMAKFLKYLNFRLDVVVRDIAGQTGLKIIEDICNGNLEPKSLAAHPGDAPALADWPAPHSFTLAITLKMNRIRFYINWSASLFLIVFFAFMRFQELVMILAPLIYYLIIASRMRRILTKKMLRAATAMSIVFTTSIVWVQFIHKETIMSGFFGPDSIRISISYFLTTVLFSFVIWETFCMKGANGKSVTNSY